MDMLSNFTKSDDRNRHSGSNPNPNPNSHSNSDVVPNQPEGNLHPKSSNIIHSAQVLADVAQSKLRHDPGKYDKAEVAGATADLLDAASRYSKMDDTKGVGKYVDKAEDYLRQYHNSHPAANLANQPAGAGKTAGGEGSADKPSHGGGGAGDLMKMAGDFLKK